MTKKPFLVLIGGGTCSGKNNTANNLRKDCKEAVVLDTDDFYCNDVEFGTSEEVNYNFNKPENLEWDLLIDKVKGLLEGRSVFIPAVRGTAGDKQQIYENGIRKIKFTRVDDKELRKPSPVIIVVGVHALQNEELRNLADLKVFMDTSIDLRLILKIKRSPYYKDMEGMPIRDIRNFGRPKSPETKGFQRFTESIMDAFYLWNTVVKPSEMKFVIPTKENADLCLEYNETRDFYYNVRLLNAFVDLYFNDPEKYQKMLEGVRNKETVRKTLGELKLHYENMIEEREKSRKLYGSLYELVKQKSQEKARPLKIIADWDDYLQPVKPLAIYKSHPLSVSFEQFFHNFWEGAIINPTSVGGDKLHEEYKGSEEEKIALANFEKERQARKANPELYAGSYYVSEERFNAPLTFLAKDLFQCLKENLVSELVIISSYRKTSTDGPKVQKFLEQERDMKKNKILKTFGLMPQCKLEFTEVEKDDLGKYRPFRWEIIKKNHPDFDIYTDDSTRAILGTRENFSDDKIYVFPDYKCARHIVAPNIYHVKTGISDLKDEDFVKAAEEYKTKKEQELATTRRQVEFSREREANVKLWVGIGCGILGVGLVGVLVWLVIRKEGRRD